MTSILLAIVAGVLAIMVGYLAGYIVKITNVSHVPPECADWNREHVMEKSLFLTGFLVCLIIVSGLELMKK
jgi:hypothetical protein